MEKIDYSKAIDLGNGIYWVGYNFQDLYFHTNAYLIVDGDEAALIDPGSMVDFDEVLKKVKTVCPVKKIRHIILQHQDPDLCGSTLEFEKLTRTDVYMAERTSIFAKFYGIKSFVNMARRDGDCIRFKSGRKLTFYMTPYCHSPGAMATYDGKSGILFTSDIFGAFNMHWELYADMYPEKEHVDSMKRFMQPYMASKEAVLNTMKKFAKLKPKMMCPQHGSIIRKDVQKWITMAKGWKYGTAITDNKSGLELRIFGPRFGKRQG